MSHEQRLEPIAPSPLARLLLGLSRRKISQLTGVRPEGELGPVEAYARLPRLMIGYGVLEEATARLHGVPERLKVLAELKAATLTSCEYCIDIGSHIARRAGIGDEQLLALPHYGDSEHFDADERLVLDYAVAMSRTPVEVSDQLFARLRARFEEPQIVELTNLIAVENMRGRFNMALGYGASGFTEGMVCAVPEHAAEQTPAPAAG